MSVQRDHGHHPAIDRTFTAVRAALPPDNAAAFDTELREITSRDVVDTADLDAFLTAWWRIANRVAADPADWRRMHDEAAAIQAGHRPTGPSLTEVLARRGARP